MSKIKKVVFDVLDWLDVNLIYVQLFLLIFALAIGAITSNLYKGSNDGYIIALLVALGTNLIILAKGYLKKIASNTTNLLDLVKNKENDIVFIKGFLEKITSDTTYLLSLVKNKENDMLLSKIPPGHRIYEAERKLFISGTSMTITRDIYHLEELNKLVDRGVEVILAITEFDNPCVDNYLREVFGKTSGQLDIRKREIEDFKLQFKGEIIYTNIFIPIAYTAIDYDYASTQSIIYAKHYILRKEGSKADYFYLNTYPRSPLFEIYNMQIKLIKDNGGNLSKNKHDGETICPLK